METALKISQAILRNVWQIVYLLTFHWRLENAFNAIERSRGMRQAQSLDVNSGIGSVLIDHGTTYLVSLLIYKLCQVDELEDSKHLERQTSRDTTCEV